MDAPPADEADDRSSAAQVADAFLERWQEIGAALSPIIGQRGVDALLKRSLHLTSATHPWLAGIHEGAQSAIEAAALQPVFSKQSGADAGAGARALLQTFHDLLASLIGLSLTDRLLRSVLADSLSGSHAQDTSP